MKAQTQAVTAILITGVMTATLASLYAWGTPLLEKRQDRAEITQLENEMINLRDEVQSVANDGTGSGSEVEISLPEGELLINDSSNYVEIRADLPNNYYTQNSWTLLQGDNMRGLSFTAGDYVQKDEDRQGVIGVTSLSPGSDGSVKYRVEFRNVLDEGSQEPRIEQINLIPESSESSRGDTTLGLINQGVEVNENGFELSSGEKVDLVKYNIGVEIR